MTEPQDSKAKLASGSKVAVACTTEQTQLGEGVRWDAQRGELLRVDILAGRVYRDQVKGDGSLVSIRVYDLPWTIGMIAPVEGDGGWLLGAGRGFAHLAPDGSHSLIAEVSPAGTRMNDGACDPQGRFWAGTLADDHHEGGGALYRLERDGRVELMLDELTISNGVGWSPDGLTMYLVDSGPRVIHAFAFDADRGTISAGRILVTVPENVGSPDGMTVGAAGDLWVAIYGGGQVHRYAPDGSLREVHTVPGRESTCCATYTYTYTYTKTLPNDSGTGFILAECVLHRLKNPISVASNPVVVCLVNPLDHTVLIDKQCCRDRHGFE